MKPELEKLLRNFNDGSLRGAQKKLAQIIVTSESCISDYIKGKRKISENHSRKLAEKSNKTENEIKKIFDLSTNNNIVGDKNNISINTENKNLKYELDLAKKEILFLKEQVDFYKSKCEDKK